MGSNVMLSRKIEKSNSPNEELNKVAIAEVVDSNSSNSKNMIFPIDKNIKKITKYIPIMNFPTCLNILRRIWIIGPKNLVILKIKKHSNPLS